MTTKEDLIRLIHLVTINLIQNRDYYDSTEAEIQEKNILDILKNEFGFDYEQDDDLIEFSIHAAQIEIWDYYLENIIPNL